MADTYYKLVGTGNRHSDWTTGVVLERDDDGNVTKEVTTAGNPLSAEDKEKVEAMGFKLEKVSKADAEEAQAAGVGSDVAGAAPVFGAEETPNQAPAPKSGDK